MITLLRELVRQFSVLDKRKAGGSVSAIATISLTRPVDHPGETVTRDAFLEHEKAKAELKG
jgi:hypothetical protein